MKNNSFLQKGFLMAMGIIFLIAVLAELFVFNFRCIESFFYEKLPEITVKFDDGSLITHNSNESINLMPQKNLTILVEDINETLKNIKLDIESRSLAVIPVKISVTDEGNADYYSQPEREIIPDIKASKYIRLNLAGKVKSLKIELVNTADKELTVNSIGFNEKVPLSFSVSRLIFAWLTMLIFYLLRPSSSVHELRPDEKQKKIVIGVFLLINILMLGFLVNINPYFRNPTARNYVQYYKLAESLLDGRFYLNIPINEKLMAMENPYDFRHRYAVGADFYWDHAYFEEKYYVYFGIVPCLLYYLPYYFITGTHLPTSIAVFISASLCVVGVMLLLKEIIRKKFPDTSFVSYLIICQMIVAGSGIWIAAKQPDIYFLPIITAAMLTLFGLFFWLKSNNGERLSARYILFGSLLMALVAGSRPQFLLGSFFIFVIFYDSFKERKILSKTSLKQTCAVIAPYIIVAAALMYYNFARFGSPFDFGANYNLTTNDMTSRGIKLDRTFLGWFTYLFQPPQITAKFPFIEQSTIYTAYQGTTITEDMFGGLFATNPFTWFCILTIFLRKQFEDKKCYLTCVLCLAFTFIITFADTQMAGILSRYISDFGLFIYFGAAIAFMSIYKSQKTVEGKRFLTTLLVICLACALAYNLLLTLTSNGDMLERLNSHFFYRMKYLIAFWL